MKTSSPKNRPRPFEFHRSVRRAAARCAAVLLLCVPAGLAQTGSAAPDAAPTVSRPGFDEARRVARTIALGLHAQASLPGFALAVGVDDEIVYSATFGFSDLEARSPVVPSTRFRIGSVGKSLTSVGAIRLSESGLLDLDQPIRRYLPDLPPQVGRVTARQLAGHLGGIRHYREGRLISHIHYDDVVDALSLFIDDPLIAAAGTSYEYSTYGYTLLSAVMQAAANRPFLELMEEIVFEPLGMRSTGPDDVTRVVPQRADFYRIQNGRLAPARWTDNSYKWAGGGLLSSAEDLVRFGLGILDDEFVSPEAREALFRSQVTMAGEETGYGMGFRPRHDRRGRPVVHHGGSSEGARAFLLLYPEDRLVIAMAANREPAPLFQEEAESVAHFFLDHVSPDPATSDSGTIDDQLRGSWSFEGTLGDDEVAGELRLETRRDDRGTLSWSDTQDPISIAVVDRHADVLHLVGTGPHGVMRMRLERGGATHWRGPWDYLGREGTARLSPRPSARADLSSRERVLGDLVLGVQFSNAPSPALALADRMEHYRVPGVSLAVIDRGRIAWTAAEGVKRSGSNTPLTPETIFQVKSLSKPVTAAAALDLVEEGLLALDTPIGERLRSWALPDNPHVRATPPTLRHLLSHRAGFTRGGVDSYRPDEEIPSLLESLAGEPPASSEPLEITFEPGSRSRYSGGGYGVLQQLLIDVTGEPFPRLMERRLFRPLGMTHSFYFEDRVPEPLLPFAAMGHDSESEMLPGGYEILPILAAGGLWSTPTDLARFILELQAAWEGRESGVLEPATVRAMISPQGDGWGLGVEVDLHDETPVFFHTGSGDGFKAIAVGYLGLGKGAVVVANGDGGGELRYEILRAIAREYDWPGFDDLALYELADVAPSRLAELVGTYRWSSGLVNQLELRDDELWTRFAENAWQRLFPLSSRRFVSTANRIYVFEGEEAEILVLRDDTGEYQATRVTEQSPGTRPGETEGWVCPPCNHPDHDRVYEEPGPCPICGMELVPREGG